MVASARMTQIEPGPGPTTGAAGTTAAATAAATETAGAAVTAAAAAGASAGAGASVARVVGAAALMFVRFAAIGTAVGALVSRADCAFVFGTCSLRNLLGYFTIESAILFAVTMAVAVVLAGSGFRMPHWFGFVRLTVATYVIVSGLVFAVLMSTAGYTGAEFLVPLSSRILHFVLPAFAILDLMLDPPRGRPYRLWPVLVFPAGWFVVTLFRGASTQWYPYFFVSPEAVGGYPQLTLYALALALILLAAFWLVRSLARAAAGDPASKPTHRTGPASNAKPRAALNDPA